MSLVVILILVLLVWVNTRINLLINNVELNIIIPNRWIISVALYHIGVNYNLVLLDWSWRQLRLGTLTLALDLLVVDTLYSAILTELLLRESIFENHLVTRILSCFMIVDQLLVLFLVLLQLDAR